MQSIILLPNSYWRFVEEQPGGFRPPSRLLDNAAKYIPGHIGGIYLTPILHDDDDSFEILVYHDYGTYYNQSAYFYDRYILEPLVMPGSRFSEATFADKLAMMNYDIHVGAILGLPGKVLAFLISLICASLPITGFLVWWWNKRKKNRCWHLLSVLMPVLKNIIFVYP